MLFAFESFIYLFFSIDLILEIQMGGNGSKRTKGLSWAQPILRFAGNNLLPLGSSLSFCAFKFVCNFCLSFVILFYGLLKFCPVLTDNQLVHVLCGNMQLWLLRWC